MVNKSVRIKYLFNRPCKSHSFNQSYQAQVTSIMMNVMRSVHMAIGMK